MINIGDSVHFQFVWDDEKPYATNFKIIGKGTVLENDEFFADEYSEKLFNQKIAKSLEYPYQASILRISSWYTPKVSYAL